MYLYCSKCKLETPNKDLVLIVTKFGSRIKAKCLNCGNNKSKMYKVHRK